MTTKYAVRKERFAFPLTAVSLLGLGGARFNRLLAHGHDGYHRRSAALFD
jgi:hypothetical protein